MCISGDVFFFFSSSFLLLLFVFFFFFYWFSYAARLYRVHPRGTPRWRPAARRAVASPRDTALAYDLVIYYCTTRRALGWEREFCVATTRLYYRPRAIVGNNNLYDTGAIAGTAYDILVFYTNTIRFFGVYASGDVINMITSPPPLAVLRACDVPPESDYDRSDGLGSKGGTDFGPLSRVWEKTKAFICKYNSRSVKK